MEGVGARLGRSSTRYGGPATVFSGPVRKWKKKWVNIPSPNSNNNNNNNNNSIHSTANGGANSNHSHLLLFKWTPISSSSSSNGNNNGSTPATPSVAGGKEASAADEAPRRKFRYVPVSAIEDQKQDISAKTDDDAKPSDADSSAKMQNESVDGKTITNDVSMEEVETLEKDRAAVQDASESSLDLNLGLKAHEGKRETDPRAKGQNEGDAEMNTATSSESARKGKRKVPAPDLEMRV